MARLTKSARRDLDDLPEALRVRAEALIRRLDGEPALGKKLLGKLARYRSARLGRSHRVVYTLVADGPVVHAIRQRRDVYR